MKGDLNFVRNVKSLRSSVNAYSEDLNLTSFSMGDPPFLQKWSGSSIPLKIIPLLANCVRNEDKNYLGAAKLSATNRFWSSSEIRIRKVPFSAVA